MKMKIKIKNRMNRLQNKGSKYVSTKPQISEALEKFYKCQAKKGLKFSCKRAAIIEYFISTDRHFTVEQLYNEMKKMYPKIGYSTVYRTLRLLADCGLASVHHFGEDDTKFELIHKAQHHDHLVCQKCGRIIEFTHDGIEEFQMAVAKRHSFLVFDHELQIYGICKKCQKKRIKKRKGS